jgi:uncharacterized protein YraI
MKLRSLLAAAAFVVALALPGIAAAQTIAYAVGGTTNMRAGPSTEYPVVAKIRGGSQVYVHGCISDYSWCDCEVQGIRGWVYAGRLEFLYAGRRVYVPEYYAYFGAPIVSFNFGYWDRYYYDEPWYDDWRPRKRRLAPPPVALPGPDTNWKPGPPPYVPPGGPPPGPGPIGGPLPGGPPPPYVPQGAPPGPVDFGGNAGAAPGGGAGGLPCMPGQPC